MEARMANSMTMHTFLVFERKVHSTLDHGHAVRHVPDII
jgi:hypothetical protein